jgi:CheY-like chemotaxis protein
METLTKKVLIVDDDEDFRTQLGMELRAAGFEVSPAGSEAEALRLLDSGRPDVAILDVMMEHMDSGLILSHRVKQRYPDVPVILVTNVVGDTGVDIDLATRDERSWVRADAVLDKPVRFEQLQREIKRLLKA